MKAKYRDRIFDAIDKFKDIVSDMYQDNKINAHQYIEAFNKISELKLVIKYKEMMKNDG